MWTLAQIAEYIGGEVIGDEHYEVDSITTLKNASAGQISFLANTKYKKYLATTHAGAVIVTPENASAVPHHAIVVNDPYVAFAKAARLFNPVKQHQPGIHISASVSPASIIHPTVSIAAQVVIEDGVELAEDVVIGPGCILQQGVKVGKGSRLIANVTVCDSVQIGQDVIIHPGVVIGADGFGIANDKGTWIKVPQIGSVIIGDDVEVGANTTIDRGALENTVIGNGVKLDNQIQIAHNVIIGDHTVIAGCVGIAGSTQIGKHCVIGGGVGISGHISITDGVQLTGMTMVTKSITKPGIYSSGIPAEPTQQWQRNVVRYRQMDVLADRIKQLEDKNK
ncbi:MAG: UDP-3-O-(3-hydroxymyristoyl)glucosamine N-acyltransferase [Gammaproteobacteria bacterium]|nr:UDP-3-O-(3-hydroxymyristoyl)glucosamine N-acyltransferase [Gammaproteobacteria bacterium]MDH5591590.1 UDP-3-O-(3-hydroxymyristoyl)glucosamine N-acyltransferase [Gammaproteobacteria bacterium]